MIEYLQENVPNSTTYLLDEMKNDNSGALERCIVENSLTDFLKFLLNIIPEYQLEDSVIARICMR